MKNTLILLSLLIVRISTYAQQPYQNDFRGRWSLPSGRDSGISLNFMDSIKMHFTLGGNNRWNGDYKYRIDKKNSDFIIMLLA